MQIPRARWNRGDVVVDVMPDGQVLANGDLLFMIDRAGRVFDRDNDAIALIEADGRVVGKDDRPLGKVGLRNAAPPGAEVAWLALEPTGEVTRFDPEGNPQAGGVWVGCGTAVRTCTFTSHLVALAELTGSRSRFRVGIGMGVGSGAGVGYGGFIMP